MKQNLKKIFDLVGLTPKQTYDTFSKCWRSEPVEDVFKQIRKNHNIDDE